MRKSLLMANYWLWEDGTVHNGDGDAMRVTYRRKAVRICLGHKPSKTYCLNLEVARRFVPNPNNYRFVKPKDNDFKNISADNIEWVSYQWACCKASRILSGFDLYQVYEDLNDLTTDQTLLRSIKMEIHRLIYG